MKITNKKNTIYVIKRCIHLNVAYNNFVYPLGKGSVVEATDWHDDEECGHGLHGWTAGFESYLDNELKGNFIILKVDKRDGYVELGDKIKFKKGIIVYNGSDAKKAHKIMLKHYPTMRLHWAYSAQGDDSTAIQGYGSTATQGDRSTVTQGRDSTAIQGDDSTAIQGYGSTATQGDGSTVTVNGDKYIYRCCGQRSAIILMFDGEMRIYSTLDDYIKGETLYISSMKIVKKYTYTPDNIDKLDSHEIIVFGSNAEGDHAGGLAKTCVDKFGAIEGQSLGIQGQSYGINTMSGLDIIKEQLAELNKFACKNTQNIFYLTKIGTGIAGYTEQDIIGILPDNMPANIILPEGWRK